MVQNSKSAYVYLIDGNWPTFKNSTFDEERNKNSYSAPNKFDKIKVKSLGMTVIQERFKNIVRFYFRASPTLTSGKGLNFHHEFFKRNIKY